MNLNFKNKWLWAIGVALVGIGSLMTTIFDGKEETKPDWGASAAAAGETVQIIKSE